MTMASSQQTPTWPRVRILAQHLAGVGKKQVQASSPKGPPPVRLCEIRESDYHSPLFERHPQLTKNEFTFCYIFLEWKKLCTISSSQNIQGAMHLIQSNPSTVEHPKLAFILAQDSQQERAS